MRKIRLLQALTYGQKSYAVGDLLEVDADFAQILIDAKRAESADAATPPPATTTATITTNLPDYDAIAQKAIAAYEAKQADKAAKADTIADQRPPIHTHDRVLDDPLRGYKENQFGEFLRDIATVGKGGGMPNRLKACQSIRQKAVGSDEYAQSDDTLGGYFVIPTFSQMMLAKGIEPEFVVSNGAQVIPVSGGIYYVNAEVDETRTGALFGGVQVYWQKERATMTATKGHFQQIEVKPKMLTGLYYVTDFMLSSYDALASIIGRQFKDALTFKRMRAAIAGDGIGEPLGVLNAGCTVSVAKETGQAAATINAANIWNMWKSMRSNEFANAVWLASNSCKPQLMQLALPVGTAGAPLMTFNIAEGAQMSILGRPLIFTEHCEAVGTVGDIILASWPSYLVGEGTYQRADSSYHVRFESNETAFRVVQMVDGQPWWRTTLTLRENLTVSPFVTLATRS